VVGFLVGVANQLRLREASRPRPAQTARIRFVTGLI
jgi:hypothetical protein